MSRKKTNKIKFELETEGGEIAQVPNNKKKPFKIEKGGIAKPLGNGFYYLQGRSHEDGGIDMTFNTDARIFSSVPFLNGKSPAERVMRGENPDTTFAWQEEFKDVNRINDDGSRKANYGIEEVSDNTRVKMSRTDVEPIKRNDEELRMKGWRTVDCGDGEAMLVPPPASGTLTPVYPEFDLLTLARSIATMPKRINVNDASSYYRQVEKRHKPIERAKEKGIIDVKSAKTRDVTTKSGITFNFGKTFDVPFFSKGKLWYRNNKKYDIIVGKDNPLLDWEMITQHGRLTQNAASAGTRRTPYYMGEANQAPTELFELYRHYPIIGYREVTNGVPTVPITGLSNLFNDENMNNSNKKRLGGSTGLIRVQANGKNRLMYVPFMGEETKANRKKAKLGISWDVNGKTLTSALAEPQTNDSKLPDKITLSPGVKSQINKSVEDTYNKNNKSSWWKNDWTAPAISTLGNIGAGLTSYFINKNMLKDLDYAPAPVAKRAVKLKTNININPELTALRENLSRTMDVTNANTASSRVANARNQAAMLNTTLNANKLYADKENRETSLINQDKLNQQEVANANIDAYNTWRTGKTTFENTIREQQSENAVSLIDNINKGIQTGITDAERRRQFRNNLAIIAAAYPNVTPALLRSYGADFLRMGGKVKLNKKK